jgi:hypothetical protein
MGARPQRLNLPRRHAAPLSPSQAIPAVAASLSLSTRAINRGVLAAMPRGNLTLPRKTLLVSYHLKE